MEEALRRKTLKPPPLTPEISRALEALVSALERLLPQLEESNSDEITFAWLLDLVSNVPSELDNQHLARAIYEASKLQDENQQQAALFDALGASEEAMSVLFEVAPRLDQIRKIKNVPTSFLPPAIEETKVDIEAERRNLLLQEAIDAQQVAAIAKAELEALNFGSATATHSIQRSSEAQARKMAEKAEKRAQQAIRRAKEAGAIVDESELIAINPAELGSGGMLNMSPEDIAAVQSALLPEGSRQYYDEQGLPRGTVREEEDGYEKVTIPPMTPDPSKLAQRLKITDILDSDAAKAFAGTSSLNPMQSTVFDIAYNKRDNMLVCAPTGAGKTNVAMLTVVSHFRDVGLIGQSEGSPLETGKKVIYIAPMKALAQEVVEKFSEKLRSLRLIVRELTGDMQLTRGEAESANVIVTTPEKWDVVTRKAGTDENSLGNQCGLLIIDEVHLLADERGAVIESLVARLHRLVESRQRQVRLVGLSATLPNYEDVASFLQVPDRALFYFGPEYRPVPLQQQFYGITVPSRDRNVKERKMNEICFDIVVDSLQRGYQCMVFVHSRKGTGDTAGALRDLAVQAGLLESLFVTQGKDGPTGEANKKYSERVKKSRNREVSNHFESGMGIHHAGMLRGDRKLTEQMFADGAIRVLVCTATLAWGINLPAHSVVIKGTEVYNPEKGGTVDLSILDVQQIFGRAGRPQFDSSGEATLITTHDAFKRYLDKLVRAVPIESNFTKQLADHLNAEVVGGTVTNIQEAAAWLTYTYLYTRMLRNPLAYGINADQKADDPMLRGVCRELVSNAATFLDVNRMVRYDKQSGNLAIVNRGRVAAHFYVQTESMSTFKDMMERMESPTDGDLCRLICNATEFHQMKIRQEEMDELQRLVAKACPIKIKGAGMDDAGHGLVTDSADKAFVLMQAYISRYKISSFTLISDMNYIASNISRVARAVFEICLADKRAAAATKLLRIAKSADHRIWWFQTPLRHFEDELRASVYSAIENFGSKSYDTLDSVLSLLEMQANEVGQLCRWSKGGEKIQKYIRYLPVVNIECEVLPITGSVLKFHIVVKPSFEWHPRWHGGVQSFWIWVEDADQSRVHHHEQILFSKRTFPEPIVLDISLPAFDPMPKQYFIRALSDSWVGVEILHPVPFDNIQMPQQRTPFTDLQDLTPLPTTALQEPRFEQLYSKFETFNPIQTQLFHVLYHTDSNVLLGAPTGSGKTIVAELALLRMKRKYPKGICVYIAPLKSLARERLKEWRSRLGSKPLGWKVLELSGDTHHDQQVLDRADILVCTPEKWDLISRGWRANTGDGNTSSNNREYVKRVKLLVLDEVHLLGEERGAVLEAIVSRTRFISQFIRTEDKNATESDDTRIMGLSTALANPLDLADWIGIQTTGPGFQSMRGLYNFKNSVRPVPLKIHIQGYPGKHYCPRMASMNKPAYAALKQHSPNKPALIFVSSRRQTRLTAFDIISYASADEDSKRFLHCDETYMNSVVEKIKDEALRHTLLFGIGLHHAGLSSYDRDVVERMFLNGDIQVLVATATLAWGVNLPAHLVIVKGTEYFDGKVSRYVDYPLTDVLQMMGRAGRPGFDTSGTAVVMAADDKKNFYKKFLFSPFPVESCLEGRLCENINAEIASGTISSIIEAVGYLTWTFYARRVKGNPSYYGASSSSDDDVQEFLLQIVRQTLEKLSDCGCIEYNKEDIDSDVAPTTLGRAASNYYLQHRTSKQMQFGVRKARSLVVKAFEERKEDDSRNHVLYTSKNVQVVAFEGSGEIDEISMAWLLYSLSSTHEFDELPVRHNEEHLNAALSDEVAWGPDTEGLLTGNWERYINPEVFEDPHTKCFLLLQAYIERTRLPISDYINDTNTVVDNIPRLLAAMEYIALHDGNAAGTLDLMTQFARTRQLFSTRLLAYDDPLVQLPGISDDFAEKITKGGRGKEDTVRSIHELRVLDRKEATTLLQSLNKGKIRMESSPAQALDVLYAIPLVRVTDTLVSHDLDKQTGNSRGTLKLTFEVERDDKGKTASNTGFSLNILVGSFQQSMLLAKSSLRLSKSGKWTVSKDVEFDWNAANADGGADGGRVKVRLAFDEIRGFDQEMHVPLR